METDREEEMVFDSIAHPRCGGRLHIREIKVRVAREPVLLLYTPEGHRSGSFRMAEDEWPMTEEEWLDCSGSCISDMLALVHGKGSERKLRLFLCACCRRIWPLLVDERSREAVETAERYADGLASEKERRAAWAAAQAAAAILKQRPGHADKDRPGGHTTGRRYAAASVALRCADEADRLAAPSSFSSAVRRRGGTFYYPVPRVEDLAEDAADIFAAEDPLAILDDRALRIAYYKARDAEFALQTDMLRDLLGNPFRPAARDSVRLTPKVLALAGDVYDGRAFDRMPFLADALEEAGCANADVLAHCRQSGPHVRGCWVLDLVLGRR
jgi:hypothetical protein